MQTIDHLSAGLVPAARFGSALARSRAQSGVSLDEMATGVPALSADDLARAEQGQLLLDDERIALIASAYGLDHSQLVPARAELVIDLDMGELSLGKSTARMPRWRRGPDQLLIRYMGLVYALRDLPPGTPVPMRDADLATLSDALAWSEDEIGARLEGLQLDPDKLVSARTAGLRRRIAVPAAGILVGMTALGTLVMVTQDPAEPDPVAAGVPAVEVGSGRSLELGPATSLVRPEVELGSASSLVRHTPLGEGRRGGVQGERVRAEEVRAGVELGTASRLTRPSYD